ncbi:MAG: precorrin-8X methylmutase [Clostridiales bacterium]|nr:precorrin-8X methylmutase [Clostridiales bacterium]MCF8022736.1 precorrin-8X methylmutase [Clostridiales bacterium]
MGVINWNPGSIMKESMEIIEQYMKGIDLSLQEKNVVKRIIHTSGDPSLADQVKFSEDAVEKGIEALKKGSNIYTDVNMICSGINKHALSKFSSEALCDIASPRVKEKAKKENITRAAAAIRINSNEMNGQLVAIGNAPTALFELLSLVSREVCWPALIIGVPVGFVGAAQSKEDLLKFDLPYITLPGTRGGSPIAAAVINAMLEYVIESGDKNI